MWNDPIVEETRRHRQAYAAEFNFDLEAIVRDLQDWERRGCPAVESSEEDMSPPVPGSTGRAGVAQAKP